MPIYHYIAENTDEGCPRCRSGFDLRRPMDRAPLTNCPLCKKPVRKVLTPFNTPAVTKPVSISDAKSAGFTVLERRCDGSFEKM
jgi:putative FmdB family regulatory protein